MSFRNTNGARRSLAALASATSANGTARNGTAVATNQVTQGTLIADVTVTIVTGSVVATVKHQVSEDNSTFTDLVGQTNVAQTTITATASVTYTVPQEAIQKPYYRTVITLSGAATAAGDLTVVTNRWLAFEEAN